MRRHQTLSNFGIDTGPGIPLYSTAFIDNGASEVWPLVDIASGTTIAAKINAARNGSLVGWDLQNAAGPVPDSLAPYSDGANDYGNIYTASLDAIYNLSVGGMFVWGKVLNAGVWTDGNIGWLLRLRVNNDNQLAFRKDSANNQLTFQCRIGATNNDMTAAISTTGWFSLALTWDRGAGANGEVKVFLNGSQSGNTKTNIGTPTSEDLSAGVALIGAAASTPTQVFNGWLAYAAVRFGTTWTPAEILALHNAAATSAPDP